MAEQPVALSLGLVEVSPALNICVTKNLSQTSRNIEIFFPRLRLKNVLNCHEEKFRRTVCNISGFATILAEYCLSRVLSFTLFIAMNLHHMAMHVGVAAWAHIQFELHQYFSIHS